MKYIPTVLIFTIIPAVATVVGFLIPNLEPLLRWIIVCATSFIYFIMTTIYFMFKQNKAEESVKKVEELNKELSGNISAYKEFIHKRKIFRVHNLERISSIMNEYNGYLRDSFRGKAHEDMRKEFQTIKTEVIKIIDDEKREFDDQLFSVSSDKDN
ncbi:hypothetical protein [Solibacillus sp. CAU 1738]|uniref:hypothetical protein n=1 Tax=Solibacillus sp. CAU 1738 TaxID=3140363 RepID=UPI00325FEB4E